LPEKLKKGTELQIHIKHQQHNFSDKNLKVFVKSNLDDWPLYNQITSSNNDPI